jgi:hypothetical protein
MGWLAGHLAQHWAWPVFIVTSLAQLLVCFVDDIALRLVGSWFKEAGWHT